MTSRALVMIVALLLGRSIPALAGPAFVNAPLPRIERSGDAQRLRRAARDAATAAASSALRAPAPKRQRS